MGAAIRTSDDTITLCYDCFDGRKMRLAWGVVNIIQGGNTMKLRKIAVAFVLLVALFAANVVPVMACNFPFSEERSVSRSNTRTAPNGPVSFGSWGPSSFFQSISLLISGQHHWHDGTMRFQQTIGLDGTSGAWMPQGAPAGTRQTQVESHPRGSYSGTMVNLTTCPLR